MSDNEKLFEQGATWDTCPTGVKHDWDSTDYGTYMFEHVYECKKCGFRVVQDSSG